jgi:hypothetical protein
MDFNTGLRNLILSKECLLMLNAQWVFSSLYLFDFYLQIFLKTTPSSFPTLQAKKFNALLLRIKEPLKIFNKI